MRAIVALLVSALVAVTLHDRASAQGRFVPLYGRVAARGAVLRDASGNIAPLAAGGRQWIVEYRPDGRVDHPVQMAGRVSILSTAAWDAFVDQWVAQRADYERTHGTGSTLVVAASSFPGTLECIRDDGTRGPPTTTLPPRTQWVAVVNPTSAIVACDALIVATSPLAEPTTPAGLDGSLLVDLESGTIVERAEAPNYFGIESAFFTPRPTETRCQEHWPDDPSAPRSVDPNGWAFVSCQPGRHGFVWAPIPGAIVSSVSGNRFPETGTTASGFYEIPIYVPQVPDAMFFNPFAFWGGDLLLVHWSDYAEFDLPAFAEVRWGRFNPRTTSSRTYFLAQHHAYTQIVGGGAETGYGFFWANFALDAVMLHAIVRMTNAPTGHGTAIPLVDTDYSGHETTRYAWVPPGEEGERRHEGYLEQISAMDLRDTDVFVFRQSDGALIGARWGFVPREVAGVIPADAPGATIPPGCNGAACLDFNVMTRGPVSRGTTGGTMHTGGFDPHTTGHAAHRLEVDYLNPTAPYRTFLRTGDTAQIVVINRTTGYIGTTSAQVDNLGGQLWIGNPGGVEIEMRPPNLRISARRLYRTHSGTHRFDSERTRTLGSGGSGLDSDERIEITTEWWDDDGRPLPPGLPGYTGRLARVIEGGHFETAATDDHDRAHVGQFRIDPGLRTQIIHIPVRYAERAHYYVQVDGTPPEGTVDFMSRFGRVPGTDLFSTNQVCYSQGPSAPPRCISRTAGAGPLAERPASFVPVLVQEFDAGATRRAYEARAAALRDAWTEGSPPPVVDGVQPVYRWLRSPEYHFSILELEVREVDLVTEYDAEYGFGRTHAEVDYGLDDGPYDPLAPTDGATNDQMMGIGYRSVVALIDEHGHVDTSETPDFPSVEELALMTPDEQAAAVDTAVGELEPADFLTLQLWDAGDGGNALWESDGSLLMVGDAHPTMLERRYETARFDPGVASPPEYTDSFDLYSFRLFERANVTVRILRPDGTEAAEPISTRYNLSPGLYHFLIDAGDVLAAGIDPGTDPRFTVEIQASVPDVDIPWTQRIRHRGRVSTRRYDLQTGQVAVGSDTGAVLLRDGSLRLQREDVTLPGAGPQLGLVRSYTNLGTARDETPFGPGWSHAWDMRLQPVTEGEGSGSDAAVPSWVASLEGRFFRWDEVPDDVRHPTPENAHWTGVAVNGTQFHRSSGAWYPERGRHGTLEAIGSELVFTAEDGTRYYYPTPLTISEEVSEITPPTSGTTVTGLEHMTTDSLAWRVGLDPALLILDTTASSGGGSSGSTTTYTRVLPPQPTLVSRIEDRNGNSIHFEYDGQGRLERLSSDDGREIVFHYTNVVAPFGSPERIERITASGSVEIRFGYDEKGYLSSVERGVEGGPIRREIYGYEREHGVDEGEYNLVSLSQYVDDTHALQTRYEYYRRSDIDPSVLARGVRATEIVHWMRLPSDAYDPASSIEYAYRLEGSEIVRTVTNGRGQPTTFFLNASGNPTRIEEPLGRVTTMHWSGDDVGGEDNVLLSRTETLGSGRTRTTSYEYVRDSLGRLIEQRETNSFGTTTTTYDPRWHRPLHVRDRNGNEQSFTYDARGNLATHVDGEHHTTTFVYDSRGLLRTVQEPGHAHARVYTYDAHGNVDTTTSPEGRVTDLDYDIRGRLIRQEDGEHNVTRFFYDDLDRLYRTEYPVLDAPAVAPELHHTSNVETAGFDLLGRQTSITTRTGSTITQTYSARGHVATITRAPGGGTRTFHYDEEGNLVSETDWAGVETTHTYDELNRLHTTTDRLGNTMTIERDLGGRVTQITDFAGGVTRYQHDDYDRPTLEEVVGGRRLEMTYYAEPDPEQNLHTVTETRTPLAAVTTRFEYDDAYHRVLRVNARGQEFHWDYDPDGDLVRVTDEDHNVREYEHDEDHLLRYQRDHADGLVLETQRIYDGAGNEIETIDPELRHATRTYDRWNRLIATSIVDDDEDGSGTRTYTSVRVYDGDGNVVLERDGRGRSRSQLRDQLGRVRTRIDGNGARTELTYDANGWLRSSVGPRSTTSIDYDFEGRPTIVREAVGRAEERFTEFLERDGMGNPRRVRDVSGLVTTFVYDANYRTTRIEPAVGEPVVNTYSRNGLLLTQTDRRSATTTYEYDQLNRRTAVVDALDHRSEVVYDETGHVVSETDPRRIVTTYDLDEMYRVRSVFRDGVRQVTRGYDRVGNVISLVDARSHETTFEYNARNLVTTITSPRGVGDTEDPVVHMRYDGAGNLVWQEDEAHTISTFEYDGQNRRTAQVVAGERTERTYDDDGNVTSILTPELRTRTLTYDALDRLVRVTEGGLETTYEYDDADRPTVITAPGGRVQRIIYDDLGRATTRITAGGGGAPDLVTTYDLYDGEGALLEMTSARGAHFRFDVDDLGRRRGAHLVGGATQATITDVEWGFDDNGNPNLERTTRRTESGTTVTEEVTAIWDRQERVQSVVQRGLHIDFGYDDSGNRTLVSAPGGETRYDYDARGRLFQASIGSDETSFDYLIDGRLDRITRANGAETSFEYEPTRRIDRILHTDSSGATIASSEYDYDHDGNRTREVSTIGGSTRTTFYGYDALSRLRTFAVADGVIATEGDLPANAVRTTYEYTNYDRTRESVESGGALVRRRDSAFDPYGRLAQISEVAGGSSRTLEFGYDAGGNLLSSTDSSDAGAARYFDYDPWDRMTAVHEGTAGAAARVRYEYDPSGQRIRELGSDRGDVEAFYAGGTLVEERRPTGGAPGALVAHYHSGPTGWLRIDGGDGERSYYHQDLAGSTVALSGPSGTSSATAQLDPWGRVESRTGTTGNRQLYTGHRDDEETGLVYMGARYYDPELGLFTQADTITGDPASPATLSRYLYALANPGRYWDPDGHSANEFTNASSSDWNENAGATGGNSNATYQPFMPESSMSSDPTRARRQLTAQLTSQAVNSFMEVANVVAAGVGAFVRTVGIGLVVVAVVAATGPIGAIAMLGVAGVHMIDRTFELHSRAEQSAPEGSFARRHPWLAAMGYAAGEMVGATQIAEAYTGHDLISDRVMTAEERATRLGEGLGAVALLGLAPSAARAGEAVGTAAREAGAEMVSSGLARIRGAAGEATEAAAAETSRAAPQTACGPAGCPVGSGRCFVAGTLIAALAGSVAIEQVDVGERVHVRDEQQCTHDAPSDSVRVAVLVPSTTRGDSVALEMLVERSEAELLAEGSSIWIDRDDLGVRGWGVVQRIADAQVEDGEGCLVTTTLQHKANDVVRVRVQGGEDIVTTPSHEFWSETAQDWVEVAHLHVGDELRTIEGERLRIDGFQSEPGVHLVFNFEVEGAHQYFVGQSRVLVHNTGCGGTSAGAGEMPTPIGHAPIEGEIGSGANWAYEAMADEAASAATGEIPTTVSPYQTPVRPGIRGRPDPARSVDTSRFTAPYSGGTTSQGFPRDAGQFWEAWARMHPEELSDTNLSLMSGRHPATGRPQTPISPRVDEQWIRFHPEHADYVGDTLIHHHVDHGRWAIPVPARTHVGSGGPLHGFPLPE